MNSISNEEVLTNRITSTRWSYCYKDSKTQCKLWKYTTSSVWKTLVFRKKIHNLWTMQVCYDKLNNIFTTLSISSWCYRIVLKNEIKSTKEQRQKQDDLNDDLNKKLKELQERTRQYQLENNQTEERYQLVCKEKDDLKLR